MFQIHTCIESTLIIFTFFTFFIEILLFAGKWMELEYIISSEIRFRKPKATCSPLYVKYRLNTNISSIIYTFKYTQNMYPKVGLVEGTKGGGKGG
jgi:hypothetical protein